jgi:hypothetical protein
MSDVIEVIVDGLWRQGSQSLAVRLVAQDGDRSPPGSPARILTFICRAALSASIR